MVPADYASGVSWTSSSGSTETWTVTRTATGSNRPDIASDLSVTAISGLPAGGVSSYRIIDSVLNTYYQAQLLVGTSVPCTISLKGFTNTTTPGSYTSLIATQNTSFTALDSATTAPLVFTAASSSTSTSVTIDPSFTFSVGGLSAACNGESNFALVQDLQTQWLSDTPPPGQRCLAGKHCPSPQTPEVDLLCTCAELRFHKTYATLLTIGLTSPALMPHRPLLAQARHSATPIRTQHQRHS